MRTFDEEDYIEEDYINGYLQVDSQGIAFKGTTETYWLDNKQLCFPLFLENMVLEK